MPHFAHREIGESDTLPEFPPRDSLKDDNSQLAEAVGNPIEREKLSPQLMTLKTADQRRAYFASKEARQSISFGPNVSSPQRQDIFNNLTLATRLTDLRLRLALGSHHNRFLLWVSGIQPRTGAQDPRRNLV
jgi:hypothetical protein